MARSSTLAPPLACLASSVALALVVTAGCSSNESGAVGLSGTGSGVDGGRVDAGTGSKADAGSRVDDDDAGSVADDDAGTTMDDGGTGDASASTADLYAKLTALTETCTVASKGKYATDEGETSNLQICKLTGAFFWKSDMDIDCDGQTTTQCNGNVDPSYFNDTSFQQSDDKPLDAAKLPYVVVPLPSSRFDYGASEIKPGASAIVLYKGQVAYGVFGDEGPQEIIGEASYAMAKSLGIDPDPATGGIESGVTFILSTGDGAVVSPIEDHAAAVTKGQALAAQLVSTN
jgi:hypothetical protein